MTREGTGSRGSWLASITATAVIATGITIATAAPAAASAGDVFAAGVRYCADTYTGHPNKLGTSPPSMVVDINFPGDDGTPLYAPEAGTVTVTTTGYGNGWGNSIIWTSANGTEQLHLAHLSSIGATGQVPAGTRIGTLGNTGNSTGAHLHVSRAVNGRPAPVVLSGVTLVPALDAAIYGRTNPCNSATYTSTGPTGPTAPPIAAGSPFGNVDGATGLLGGGVWLRGWSLDPDTTATPPIHVYVDGPAGSGARGVALPTGHSRPDVGAAYPGKGNNHGFSSGFAGLSAGAHTLYVYGINEPGTPGSNVLIQQVQVTVPAAPGGTPVGYGDSAKGIIGGIAAAGWAFDPDQPTGAVEIHAYLDGPAGADHRGANLGRATRARADVAAAHPQAGSAHGFDANMLDVAPGTHSIFLYAINLAGGGDNPLIGVLDVTVPSGSPIGSLDAATDAKGAIGLRGWAVDPDDPKSPLTIHAYLDGPAGSGRGRDMGPASVSRPDVAAVHPGAGGAHGFSMTFPDVPAGTHTVHVYALDRKSPGQNVLLGQKTVTVTRAAAVTPAPQPSATSKPTPSAKPPASGPRVVVAVRSKSRASKLFVDVNPNKGSGYWTFQVHKRNPDGSWKPGKTYRTKGKKETRTLNLKKGTYQVTVNPKYGHKGTTSAPVTLRK